jgi:hypothetical protein
VLAIRPLVAVMAENQNAVSNYAPRNVINLDPLWSVG